MKAYAFLLSASALAFSCCTPALAQTASAADQAAATDDSGTQGGDIIVTAERRSENLMQTDIAASVLDGTDLANKGVVTVDQLQFAMPSVTVNNFGQGLEFNIRGIGKAEHNTQTTTGVITYRDGVATFPGYIQEEPYYDIKNVEVLRGPQGTIAGQNSTGGAVFVTTNDPKIDGGYHGYLQGQVGNYWDIGAQGAINLPISHTLAARVAFYGESRDSFYHIAGPNGLRYTYNKGDLRTYAGRFSLLWKPTERLSVLSKTDVGHLDMGAYPADPYTNRFKVNPVTGAPNPNYTDLFHISLNAPQQALDKYVRESLQIEYEFAGGVRLRSVSGFQSGSTRYRADLDGTSAPISTFYDNVDETIYSEEVNLISPDHGRFTWLLGAYAQWNKYHFLEPYQFVTGVPAGNPLTEYRLQGTNPERSLAAFGQVGFKITPSLQLKLGARYTDSRTTNHVQVLQYGTPIIDEQSAKFHNFSYKASLGWSVDRNNYLYGFVATGFRPGGLNVPVGLGNPPPFDSEKVRSYEAGWKSTLFDGHLRTTIDAFYNDYRNFQVIIGYPDFPTFGIELNVPHTTEIYGFEGETELSLGHLTLGAGVSVLHSELGSFFATDPRAPSVLPCDPHTGPESVTCIDLGGRRQTYAPNVTFNANAAYEFDLASGDTITPRVNFGHVAGQWATLFENPNFGDRLAARNILGAQLAWKHKTLTITAYGTNLTNQHYVGALISGLNFAGPPRQYGVRILKLF
jgi:iron complex outermembrane receptor protein